MHKPQFFPFALFLLIGAANAGGLARAGTPLLIDEQRLLPESAAIGFGTGVAVDGDVALVGAPVTLSAGAVFVFERDPASGEWIETETLTANGAQLFGDRVALSGTTAVIGAPFTTVDGVFRQGAAYVFVRDPGTGEWHQGDMLSAADGAAEDEFGKHVDIDGNVIVVSTPEVSVDGMDFRGAGYVYRRGAQTGAWVQEAKLTAPDGVMDDQFGSSIAVSGDTIAVGAPNVDGDSGNQGAVYVFGLNPDNGSWFWQAKLFADDGSVDDRLGFGFPGVDLAGDRILAGARSHETSTGAAYIFERELTGPDTLVWNQVDKLTAGDGAVSDEFGFSVALSVNTALIGAPFADIAGDSSQGAAYFFVRRSAGTWEQRQKVSSSEGQANDSFGRRVALSPTDVLIGSPFADPGDGQGAADIYLFDNVVHADRFETAVNLNSR